MVGSIAAARLVEPTEKTRVVEEKNLFDPTITTPMTVAAPDPRGVVALRLRTLLDRILSEQSWSG